MPVLRRPRGFTLLELMIALGIFALIGAASYTLLSSETLAQRKLLDAGNHLSHWQRGMQRLTMDLLQVQPRSIREDYGEQLAALTGDSSSLEFSRGGWSNPLGLQRSDLQRVRYQWRSQEGSGVLQRSFWTYLDRAPGSEPTQQVVIPGIDNVQIRYLESGTDRWLSYWPASSSETTDYTQLPRAVEFTFSSRVWGEVVRLIPLPESGESQ